MRNNIRRKRNRVEKDRLVTFLAFFVVAPLISIVLGFAIVKFLIIPTFLPIQNEISQHNAQDDISDDIDEFENEEYQPNIDDEEIENKTVKQSKIEGVTLYNIQVGNFSSEENADNLIKELNSKEMLGYLVKGDSYIVFSGTYLTKEEADKYLPKIKESYSDAFINTFELQERTIAYNSEEESSAIELIEAIKAIDTAYNDELSLWYKALEVNDNKLLIDKMAKNSSNMKALISKFSIDLKSEKLVQLVSSLKDYVSDRDNIMNDLNDDEKSLRQSFSEYNEIYYKYLSFTK